MAEYKDRLWSGKGKKVGKFNQIRMGFRFDVLAKHVNEAGYVNVYIVDLKEPDEHGNTLTSYIDEYKPTKNNDSEPIEQKTVETKDNKNDVDLPF